MSVPLPPPDEVYPTEEEFAELPLNTQVGKIYSVQLSMLRAYHREHAQRERVIKYGVAILAGSATIFVAQVLMLAAGVA